MKLRLAGISAAAVLAGALSTGSPVLAATATTAHSGGHSSGHSGDHDRGHGDHRGDDRGHDGGRDEGRGSDRDHGGDSDSRCHDRDEENSCFWR